MDHKVKIIIERLNRNEIKKINNYLLNLKEIIGENISVTILDPRHNADYNNLVDYYSQLSARLPNVNIINFYLSFYLVSDAIGNVNNFIKQYIGGRKFNPLISGSVQSYFLPDSQEIIQPKINKVGDLVAVDITKKGEFLQQRISVNRKGNIQVVRNFDEKTHRLLFDEYLDTELNTQLKINFNKQGQKESYHLVGKEEPIVFSEIDLFDQWFEQTVNKDDFIINMNHDFNIILSSKYDEKKLFLM